MRRAATKTDDERKRCIGTGRRFDDVEPLPRKPRSASTRKEQKRTHSERTVVTTRGTGAREGPGVLRKFKKLPSDESCARWRRSRACVTECVQARASYGLCAGTVRNAGWAALRGVAGWRMGGGQRVGGDGWVGRHSRDRRVGLGNATALLVRVGV